MNQLVKKSVAECRRWFAALLLVAAGSLVCLSAQDQLVTVKVDNRPVSEAIKIIEKESNMIFFYQSGVLDLNRTWKLPKGWSDVKAVMVTPVEPDGEGTAQKIKVTDGAVTLTLAPNTILSVVPAK